MIRTPLTAAANNKILQDPILLPDFSRVFVLIGERADEADDRLFQTAVALKDVLTGVGRADTLLANAVIHAVRG